MNKRENQVKAFEAILQSKDINRKIYKRSDIVPFTGIYGYEGDGVSGERLFRKGNLFAILNKPEVTTFWFVQRLLCL